MSAKPIASRYKLLSSFLALTLAKPVVIAQSPLRNRDRVILQGNFAPVVKLRNSSRIVRPSVIRLLVKQHVVFAESMKIYLKIYPRGVMPKTEMASPRH